MATSKRHGITVTELLNQCTGIMRIDSNDNYAGYYTRKELQGEMLAEGHDPKHVDFYIFSIKECRAEHPVVAK